MNAKEAEKAIARLEKKHHVSKWIALVLGAWLLALPLLPDTFPYLNWLRARDPGTLYTMLGVFSIAWAMDNWRTTKELELLRVTLELGQENA